MNAMSDIAQTTTRFQDMEIILLRHFGFCAVITGGEDGGYGTVFIQGSIYRAIGGKGRKVESPAKIEGTRNSQQTRVGTRRMGPDARS